MISLRHVTRRSCRHFSQRTYATSRQKRALNETQLGGSPTETAASSPPNAGGTSPSGGSSALPIVAVVAAAGGFGAYYMDLIPGLSSSETPASLKEAKASEKDVKEEEEVTVVKTEESPKEKVKESAPDVAESSSPEAASSPKTTGNRVMKISLPEGKSRSSPPKAVTQHPFGGNRVSMVPTKTSENTPSVDTALRELQSQISKDDTTRSLLEAHKDLATLASMDLSELDQMSVTQLKVRLIQMAKDMEERTKWEAVRLKEFLAMKEKEVEDKYSLVLKRQTLEAESVLEQRLREQKDKLERQAEKNLREKEEALQTLVEKSLKIQEQQFEDEKTNFEKVTEEKYSAKYEELFGTSLAKAKEDFARRMEQKVQQIESLAKKLSDLEFALQTSKSYQSGSLQAHRMSAAALALIDKLESSQPAGAALEALKSVSESNTVVNSAISVLPQSVSTTGIATLQELQTKFEEQVHPKCRQAAMVPTGQAGLEGQLLGMVFAGLRFAPGPEETAPESEKDSSEYLLARARRHVQMGELEQAVSEMGKLKGQAAFTASDWTTKAKERVAVEKALKVIRMECALANEQMAKAN